MRPEQTAAKTQLTVRNIGGIETTSVEFTPGVTVLSGENATNRTSLLQAIMAALGSDDISIKGDADTATVELEIDGETYSRTLTRKGKGTTVVEAGEGEACLDDPTLADLFAFLLESNEARRAVATDVNPREIIMRPVDTDEIQAEIDRLLERRDDLEEELDELAGLKDRRPALEERRRELQAEIGQTRADLAAKEEELEARDANVEQTREEKAELEERLADLRAKRAELEEIRYELETERESLESMRAQKRELDVEFEELPEAPVEEIDGLEARIDRLREQKRSLESEINEIQNVIQFNQGMLDSGTEDPLDVLESAGEESVTGGLLPDETVACWTCGSDVSRGQIESTVDRLRELSQDKLSEIDELEGELEDLTGEIEELKGEKSRRERLKRRRSDIEAEIERGESNVDRLTDRREALRNGIESLESEIESLEDDSYQEILDIHREANQLEYELGRLEGELEDVESELADVEDRLDAESELRSRRQELTAEIEECRTRIDRIERQAVEEFNGHMDSILERLGYSNLERIWLERVERDVREGRRTVTKRVFELHIVRQTDTGATYEDTVDHLSESEREVTGLVFALAGYLAHGVHEDVPFMLLDSLEAIDSERIAALVEYVEGFSEYLVVALLPEDAAALPEGYRRIEDI
jgi:DNA repair exonuclease SbcCD ATPase subunit